MVEMDPFSTFFGNSTESFKTAVESNNKVFTPEIMEKLITHGLVQHALIEEKIKSLINLTSRDVDLTTMIATLRSVSLTYLPKV